MARSKWQRALIIVSLILAGEAIFTLPYHVTRFFRPTFLEVFELSATELGVAQSAYGFIAMAAYFFGGPLADRFESRKLLAGSLWATALGGIYDIARGGLADPAKQLLNNDHIGNIDEERADQGNDDERLVARPVALGDSRHISHGGGCRAHRETTETGRHHRRFIVFAHESEYDEDNKDSGHQYLSAENQYQRPGETGKLPQLHAHQRHGEERTQ